ncbi:MAG: AAA family ATPase, partial [Pirellulales bacterium]
MRLNAIALIGMRGWPDVELPTLSAGLNVVCGPPGSGKSTLAEFLAHVLFGKLPSERSGAGAAAEGEAMVESGGRRFRLRRYQDGTRMGRLTVASLNDEPVDRDTVRGLLGGLSPGLLARVFAVNFEPAPQVDGLVAAEFAHEFHSFAGVAEPGRKATELAARRDALAEELETRIAGERRASGELEQRRRELERRIRDAERAAAALELRTRAVETTLAETDARLRYRRLELNTELRWHATDAAAWEPQVAELDQEIARWRATITDLAQREASVRSKLAQAAPSDAVATALGDQRAWTAVARQLAADLEGEVARLARGSASEQCVCGDAHPRLRPIVETLSRQLDRLESLVDVQQRAAAAADWREEAEHLARSQAELRRHLEHLLDRRQSLVDGAAPGRRRVAAEDGGEPSRTFSAADAEQLEQRRLELEQERFSLIESLRKEQTAIRGWRAERADVDRQRAALLSARSIEHVQRELAGVQRKLERATAGGSTGEAAWSGGSSRASDYLAQLTDGRLVRIELAEDGRRAWAVRKSGETVSLESLAAAERDQVVLSNSLALAATAARHGVRLPLVLDEPFVRLDERGTSAVAAVLDAFSRQGHQMLVFESHQGAIDRLTSLGAGVHELTSLRRRRRDVDDLATVGTPIIRPEPFAASSTTTASLAAKKNENRSKAADPRSKARRDT